MGDSDLSPLSQFILQKKGKITIYFEAHDKMNIILFCKEMSHFFKLRNFFLINTFFY